MERPAAVEAVRGMFGGVIVMLSTFPLGGPPFSETVDRELSSAYTAFNAAASRELIRRTSHHLRSLIDELENRMNVPEAFEDDLLQSLLGLARRAIPAHGVTQIDGVRIIFDRISEHVHQWETVGGDRDTMVRQVTDLMSDAEDIMNRTFD